MLPHDKLRVLFVAVSGVLAYLRQQNRPYSVNDIVGNLHNAFGKTAAQKALDHLVEKDEITVKAYGKQTVYVIKQVDCTCPKELSQQPNDTIAHTCMYVHTCCVLYVHVYLCLCA